MPELPEVRTVCKKLRKEILNSQIVEVNIFLPKLLKNITEQTFIKNIINSKIIGVDNYGKFILIQLDNEKTIVSHLRMEGKYRVENKSTNKIKHDHLIFKLSDNKKLIYNDTRAFGTFNLKSNNDLFNTAPLNKLAKEPQDTDLEWLHGKLSKKIIPIKSSLLDQELLVGLGNIYVNEVLWSENIDPRTQSKLITSKQLKGILNKSAEIMDHSTELGGSTIDSYKSLNNETGSYQDLLNVHGKENNPCPRCNDQIKKIFVGGRGTYYCSKCIIIKK